MDNLLNIGIDGRKVDNSAGRNCAKHAKEMGDGLGPVEPTVGEAE